MPPDSKKCWKKRASKEHTATWQILTGWSRATKDFDAGFPDIGLLMYKSYAVMHPLPDEIVLSDGFSKVVIDSCKAMVDFNRFLNRAFDI